MVAHLWVSRDTKRAGAHYLKNTVLDINLLEIRLF